MPELGLCPQCRQPLTVPAGAAPDAVVRCPLCDAEYGLDAALAEQPPTLIVVHSGGQPDAMAAAFNDPLVDAQLMETVDAEVAEAAAEETELAEVAADEAEPDDFDVLRFEPGPQTSADAGIGYSPVRPAIEEPQFDVGDEPEFEPAAEEPEFEIGEIDTELEVPEGQPVAETGEVLFSELTGDDEDIQLEPREEEAPDFDFGGVRSDEYQRGIGNKVEASSPPRVRTGAPRKRKQTSIVNQLVGVVGGGVIGLTLGYIILLWIGGPDRDFLKLGRTLPSFMVPAEFNPKHAPVPPMIVDTDKGFPQSGSALPESQVRKQTDAPDSGFAPLPPLPNANVANQQNNTPESPSKAPSKEEPASLSSLEQPTEDPLTAPEPDFPVVPLDPPAGVPELPATPAPTAGAGKLREPAQVSSTEVGSTLTALAALNATIGDPSKSADEKRKVRGPFFRNLYQLADLFTQGKAAGNKEVAGHAQRFEQIIKDVAADPARLRDMEQAGPRWLARRQPGQRHGIVLAGTVESVGKRGAVHEIRLAVSDIPTGVVVLSAEKPAVQPTAKVVVVGTVVDKPVAKVEGYEGPDEQVIWLGLLHSADAKKAG